MNWPSINVPMQCCKIHNISMSRRPSKKNMAHDLLKKSINLAHCSLIFLRKLQNVYCFGEIIIFIIDCHFMFGLWNLSCLFNWMQIIIYNTVQMNKQIARQGISWVSSNWLSFGRVSNIKNELLTFLELSPFFFKINF